MWSRNAEKFQNWTKRVINYIPEQKGNTKQIQNSFDCILIKKANAMCVIREHERVVLK